jgi:hypothetical protein
MTTNSSFAPNSGSSFASAYLFPSFRYVPEIPLTKASIEDFVKAFVLPENPSNIHRALTESQRKELRRDSSLQDRFSNVRPVDEVIVLICGHGGRDQRCGVLGPILQLEFEDQLRRRGFTVSTEIEAPRQISDAPRAHIGLISHVGGHKFAGNVIIYIPPTLKDNPLSGKGIWYGRVATDNVEGIVKSTIFGGEVIKDKFRGGIGLERDIIRL